MKVKNGDFAGDRLDVGIISIHRGFESPPCTNISKIAYGGNFVKACVF